MADDPNAWYKPSLEVYHDRTKAGEKLIDYIRSKEDILKLSSKKQLLSIGPGSGDQDVPFVTSCCANLTHYIGVEPNEESAKALEERLMMDEHSEHLKVEIVKEFVEAWSGPDQPVDLILLSEVLYYFRDPKIVFAKCRDWLSPGGVMIIVHSDDDIFYRVARELNIPDSSYSAKYIQPDLRDVGIEQVEAGEVPLVLDLRDRQINLMNFLLHKTINGKEFQKLDELLTNILPGGIEYHNLWVFWWTKS